MAQATDATVESADLSAKVSGLIQTLLALRTEIDSVLNDLESGRSSEPRQVAETLTDRIEAIDPCYPLAEVAPLSERIASHGDFEPVADETGAEKSDETVDGAVQTKCNQGGFDDDAITILAARHIRAVEHTSASEDIVANKADSKDAVPISLMSLDASVCKEPITYDNSDDSSPTITKPDELESSTIESDKHCGTEIAILDDNPSMGDMILAQVAVPSAGRRLFKAGAATFVGASLAVTVILSVHSSQVAFGRDNNALAASLEYLQPTFWLNGSDTVE